MKRIEQITLFETQSVKTQCIWSIYAVPRYREGSSIEFTVKAYTEKQARFLFHKLRDPQYQYMVTGCFACV